MDFLDRTFWKTMGFKAHKLHVTMCSLVDIAWKKKMITLFVISSLAQPISATTFNWNAGTADWSVGANWTPAGGPPTAADDAVIANGGTARTDTDTPTARDITVDTNAIDFTNQNLTSQNATLGNAGGSNGTVTVDLGRTWTNSGTLTVGNSGRGNFTVQMASIMNTANAQIAVNSGSTGNVTIRDAGTAWNISNNLAVGFSGTIPTFIVQTGAALSAVNTQLALIAGGPTVNVTIRDNGTTFSSSGTLTVAQSGTATMLIRSAANATTGSCILGLNAGSNGTLTVQDLNTTWANSSSFIIGEAGTGVFILQAGATATGNTCTLGLLAGSSGTATITDGNTAWTNTGTLTVGSAGVGILNIANSAQVTASNVLAAVNNSGTVNITNAARLTTGAINGGSGTGSFALNNATLRASASSATFLSGFTTATLANNATFDTQAFTDTVPQNLTGSGTLTKIGTGTLILTGTNSLTGSGVISAGTLQGNAANLPQAGITDNGVLIFDQATTGTYSSNITGAGALVKQNAGTLILTGTNSYAGGTTIAAGTLQGNTNSIPSTGGVIDNGILVFDQGFTGTFSGNITGTGSLVKQNTGILILTGNNSYSGGTTINAGTLQGNTNSIPSGPVLNQSVLIFDQAFTGVFSGNISGTGTLIKQNTGTLILSGANTYTGNTVIAQGTLQGNTNSIPSGNVIDSGTFILDQNFDGTFAGALSGTGVFLKQGTGTVNMTGNGSGFSGSSTIVGGTLNVTGILAGSLLINSGTTLSGTGVLGNVTNSGTISPGSPGSAIGTLHVNNFVNNPSGIYQAQINSAGQADQIMAAGTATLNGGTLAVTAFPGIYLKGTTYTIIDAAGGLTGQFASTLLPTNVLLGVSYLPNQLILTVLATTLDTTGLSGNALRVANYIRNHVDANPDILTIIAALNTLTPAQEQKALDQLHPALFEALSLTAGDTAHMINSTFVDRLKFLRNTYDPCDCCPCPRGNIWIAGAGDFVRQNKTQGLRGFNTSSEGVAIGYDNRIYDTIFAGIGVGYSHTNLHWENSAGHANINGFYTGTYATYECNYGYVDATILGFVNNYNVRRHIHFSTIDRTAKHKSHSYGLNPHLGAGLYMNYCTVDVIPFADADYYFVQQNKFHEHGADSIDLHVKRNHANLIRFEAGVQLAKSFDFCGGCLLPNASVSYVGHRLLSGKKWTAAFTGINADFSVFGSNELFNQLEVGAGLDYFINDQIAVNTWYDIELGDKRQEQEVNVEVNYRF